MTSQVVARRGRALAQADSFVRGTPRFRQAEGVSFVMGYFLRRWVPYVDAPFRVALEPRIRKVAEEVVWEDDDEEGRSWMVVDWHCRVCVPAWLRAAGFAAEAAAIEAAAVIVDEDSADDALPSVEAAEAAIEARGEPWSYRRATRDRGKAAWRGLVAAADDAVRACGGEAANGAGDADAYPYISDPACWAIENAAWTVAAQAVPWDVRDEYYDTPAMSWAMVANASAALRPTVIALQQSALELLDRMIAAGTTRATAYLMGKPNVRRPGDVSRVVGSFLREWMMDAGAWSQSLLESYISKVAACGSGLAADERRGWMLVDWFCRVYTPAWLREAGFAAEAAAIEATAAIVDQASAEAVIPSLLAAIPVTDAMATRTDLKVFGMGYWPDQPEAWSMGYRAWQRVCDVANDAIWASGGEAAYEAMGWEVEQVRVAAAGVMQHATLIVTARAGSEVAGDGWRGATATVAPAVAYATVALRPTVIALQQSGLELLDRMIADRGE